MKGLNVRAWLGKTKLAPRVVDSRLAKNKFACLNGDSLDDPHIVSRIEQLFPEHAPWELDAATSQRPMLTNADQELVERIFGG